jgi:serine/threonine-protein kinase
VTGPLNVGDGFAGYRIVRRLGVGGMGEVYLADHPRLPRQDALKVLTTAVQDDPSFRVRFDREAAIAANLFHPHIVPLHDRGEEDGRLWISMAYVEGTDAAVRAARYDGNVLPAQLVGDIVTAVGSALDYAHERGLLHRDVKPGNILLTDSATPHIYLADFGIAKAQDSATGVTGTGAFVGSLPYVSPEQIRADTNVTGALDQYQLACTAFELLAGEPPYAGPGVAAVLNQHLHSPPPSPRSRRPDLSSAVDEVFARAMAKDPAARYPSCAGFAAALSAALHTSAPAEGRGDSMETVRLPVTGETVVLPPARAEARPPTLGRQSGEEPTLRHNSAETPTVRRVSGEQQPSGRLRNSGERSAQAEPRPPAVQRTRHLGPTDQGPVDHPPVPRTIVDKGAHARTEGQVAPGGGRRRAVLIGAGVALVVAIVAVFVLMMGGDDEPTEPATAGGPQPSAGPTSRTSVPGVSDATSVVAGTRGACAVADAKVFCWGENAAGQLGDGTTEDRETPVQAGDLTGVTAVSTDAGTTCAISDGAVYCWGSNSSGQLGNGSADDSLTPVRVPGLSGVTAIATHSETTCAVAGGAAHCWGRNDSGQVGDGTTDNRSAPTRVPGLSRVTAISTSHGTTCAVADKTAQCWGLNEAGQLGDGSTDERATIVQVAGLTDVSAIDVGYNAVCAIDGGTAYCWGLNESGQLGDGTTENRGTPTQVGDIGSATSVSAGVGQACAVSDGTGYCWGYNGFGQLGDGTTEDRTTAVRVTDLSGLRAIGAGEDTTCAVSGGKVYCWGELAS